MCGQLQSMRRPSGPSGSCKAAAFLWGGPAQPVLAHLAAELAQRLALATSREAVHGAVLRADKLSETGSRGVD